MIEIPILRALLDKQTYQKYRNYISSKDFPDELVPVLQAIDELQQTAETSVSIEDVGNALIARGITDKSRPYIRSVFDALKSNAGADTVDKALEKLKQIAISNQIALRAVEVAEGRGSVNKILELAEQLGQPVQLENEFVTSDIKEILNTAVLTPGLRWRLNCLNRSLGSLRKGNFGFIFARPETGKTSFIASEVTHMAEQLKPEDGPILWFANEEPGYMIRLRQYQAALGATLVQIKAYPDRAQEAFKRRTNDKILLVDTPVLTKAKIASLAVLKRPSLIVIDQIDKIYGFDSDRKDLELGSIYQWARELAKKHCPVIGVCQADGTAEGIRYLTMAHIANSKTSKAAEADWILGIGKDNSPGYDYVRFLSILKNKLTGDVDTDPALRHAQFEVIFKPEIARYLDMEPQE